MDRPTYQAQTRTRQQEKRSLPETQLPGRLILASVVRGLLTSPMFVIATKPDGPSLATQPRSSSTNRHQVAGTCNSIPGCPASFVTPTRSIVSTTKSRKLG